MNLVVKTGVITAAGVRFPTDGADTPSRTNEDVSPGTAPTVFKAWDPMF